MRGRIRCALAAAAASIAALLAGVPLAPAQASDQSVITSAGPLTAIYLNDDLGCQVQVAHDVAPAFYGASDPGDCGTYLATGSALYGPANGPPVTADFTAVTRTPVTGAGSSASPYRVTTVTAAGALATITQTDSYVVGQDYYSTSISVADTGSVPLTGTLYHAGDCYVASADQGFGAYDPASGGVFCSLTPGNIPPNRVLGFVPATPASYQEGLYSSVWSDINATAPALPDLVDGAILEDNGAGLSWPLRLAPGTAPATFGLRTVASPRTPTSLLSPNYLPAVLPPPVLFRFFDVEVVSGQVLIKLPGRAGFVPLAAGGQIPVGAILDTLRGVVQLTSATGGGGTQSGDFTGGFFKVVQSGAARQRGLTTLVLIDRLARSVCGGSAKGRARIARRKLPSKVLGLLTGTAHGKFAMKGTYSSATVRGTQYGIHDQCNGTLTRVEKGVVVVDDFRRHRRILLRAGKHYLAKPR